MQGLTFKIQSPAPMYGGPVASPNSSPCASGTHTTTCSKVLIGSQYVGHSGLRFARNQIEAGIAHLPWETRLKPLRPISRDIALGIGVASTIAAACFLV